MGFFKKAKGKNGQITLFIMIGIAMLVAIGLFFYVKSTVVDAELGKGSVRTQYLEEIKQSVTFAVENCVGLLIDEYVFKEGISQSGIQSYINSNQADCIKLNELIHDDEIVIDEGTFLAVVQMSNDEMNLKVDVSYPITIEASYGRMDFSEFDVDYKLYIDVPLKMDSGVTYEHTMVKKGDISFTVQSGTAASENNIKIKLINFPAGAEDTKLGPIYFDIYPKGATFNPPGKLKYAYRAEFLNGYPEGNIRLGWKDGAYWYPYTTETYPADNYIIGLIDMVH